MVNSPKTSAISSLPVASTTAGDDKPCGAVKDIINDRLFDLQETQNTTDDQMSQLSLSSTRDETQLKTPVSNRKAAKQRDINTRISAPLQTKGPDHESISFTEPPPPDKLPSKEAKVDKNKPSTSNVKLPDHPENEEKSDEDTIVVESDVADDDDAAGLDDFDSVYQDLIARVTSDENSFPDDPVLKSLRTLRQTLLNRLEDLHNNADDE